MKPRIIILMHYMELGGAESALLGLLQSIDTERVDVDLFVYDHRGDLFPLIPTDKINLLPQIEAYSMIERPLIEVMKKGYWGIAVGRIMSKWQTKRYKKSLNSEEKLCDISVFPRVTKNIMPFLPSLYKYGEYDLAISFLQPHNILLEKVKAKKKIAWIHTDYSTVHVDVNTEKKIWEGYDYIASISDDVSIAFLKTFPSLKEKIVVIENILSPEFVRRRAEEKWNDSMQGNLIDGHSKIVLLSIGRICHQKNFDNIPFMAKELLMLGWDFHWYIVGPGNHDSIDEKLRELGVKDYVTFLGATANPYPYIKACDIYVQPSRYEGKSVTVREAQVLSKPVVITDYPTAKSQIKNGIDGIICGMDNKAIAKAIFDLANDKNRRIEIIRHLMTHDYGNTNEVEKIYNLL